MAKRETLKAKGVKVILGDYNDPASLNAAFKGVDKLYFVSAYDIMNRFSQHQNVVRAAVEAEVGHIFYTSAQRKSEDVTSPIALIADAHWKTDNLIKASGLTYTILKHGLYTDILPIFLGDKVICYFAGALDTELSHGVALNALMPLVLSWIVAFLRDKSIFLPADTNNASKHQLN